MKPQWRDAMRPPCLHMYIYEEQPIEPIENRASPLGFWKKAILLTKSRARPEIYPRLALPASGAKRKTGVLIPNAHTQPFAVPLPAPVLRYELLARMSAASPACTFSASTAKRKKSGSDTQHADTQPFAVAV